MPSRAQLEALLADDGDDVFLNYALACLEANEGQLKAARAAFDRVIALDADYVPAYFQKGQTLARADDLPAARETLRAGIAVATRVGDQHALGEMTQFLESLPDD